MRYRVVLLMGALLLGCIWAPAQEITGDIRGVVKDSSGAVVTGATVQVINTDRNAVIRETKTGSDGSYVASYLPIGHYKVVVKQQGFKDFTALDIVINVNDHRIIDASLQPGGGAEVVNVVEAAQQVNTENATASGLITGTQIRELSVATRNYEQLVSLVPGVSQNLASDQLFIGVTNPTGTSNQVNFMINGNRATQNNWSIDGADNVDRGANLTLLNYPSIDAIAEFNVLRSNYLPEHGRSSSGEVNVITRSGTSAFHGSAYEFFRNDVLNANNFFNNRNGVVRPPLRWNDFGFTIGGPVMLPHYNGREKKTFFFYSQEFRRIITYATQVSSPLPTQAELGGAFPTNTFAEGKATYAGKVCTAIDASGKCTATGNQITNIDPTAAAYIKDIYSIIPVANSANNQLTWVGRNIFNYREENVRIDHTFNDKFSIFGRYLDDSIPTVEPGGLFTGLGIPGVATTSTNSPGRSAAIHGTYTVSPTLVADMGYAYSYGAVLSTPSGTDLTANSPDVKPTLPFGLGPRLPNVSFSDVTLQGIAGFGPYRDFNYNHNIFGTVSKAMGHHALKFGASYNHYTKDENVNGFGNNAGSFSFSGSVTNGPSNGTIEQEWANFLMGNVASFNQQNIDFRALVHQNQVELFGQDEWRVSPRLTLSYGLRYSLFMAPTYGNGLLTTFDPALFDPTKVPAIAANGSLATPVTSPYANGIIVGGQNSPFGDAVQRTPKDKFAPRLGIAWDPRGDGKTAIRSGFGIFYDSPAVNSMEQFQPVNPPFVQSAVFSATSFSNPGGVAANPNLSVRDIGGVFPNWKQPYSMMWSLDVQRQVTPSTSVDIGYYGTAGRHLVGVVDFNQAPAGAFQTIGLTSPVGSGSSTAQLNRVRPFQGYASIDLFDPVFTSNYNGLQAQVQKHFTANTTVVVNYTWSHALGTASNDFRAPQNSSNIRGEYGNLDYDRRHVLTASYVYDLPFRKDQQGAVGHVLGGWEVSGIIYANSGQHLTASASLDPAGLGLRDPNTFEGGRPDLVGDPNSNAPHTITQWFNTSAFATVPGGQIRVGNEPRGTIVGPGYFRWDASLFKNTKISERFGLQFRAEAFNVLNHTNFNNPSASITTPSLFGKITTARDARQMQLALKLLF
jgi:hypothetical protein